MLKRLEFWPNQVKELEDRLDWIPMTLNPSVEFNDDLNKIEYNINVLGMLFFDNGTGIKEEDLDIDFSAQLGSGTFGTIYNGTLKKEGATHNVAVKLFYYQYLKEEGERQWLELPDWDNRRDSIADFIAERDVFSQFENNPHPNLVHYHGWFVWTRQEENMESEFGASKICFGLVLEKGIPLEMNIISNIGNMRTRQRMLCSILNQILDGIIHLHKKAILHRDLKISNIIRTEDNTIKVIDLGIAKSLEEYSNTLCGTMDFMAPEVRHQQILTYGQKADVYSIGVIAWCLWHGVPYRFGQSLHYSSPLPSKKLQKILEMCTNQDPKDRPFCERVNVAVKKFVIE